MRILKLRFLLIILLFSVGLIAQNSQIFPNKIYLLLKQKKVDSIIALIDTTHIPKVYLDSQKELLKTHLVKFGKPKKLIAVLEDEAGVKKRYALQIQFKKGKKNLNLLINSHQKIERINITDFIESPYFQLKGYKGFSEVTDLTTQVNCKDGLTLGANIAFGDTSKGKSPIVVFVHGSGASDRDETIGPNKPFRDLAQGLAQQGIVSLRYDKRGYDYTKLSQQQIDSMDLYSETINDAIDAIKATKQFTFIDTAKIYIVGHSLGAMCAPKIAELSQQLKGIVMLGGPAKNLVDILPQQAKEMALLDDTISNAEEIQINQSRWFAEKVRDPKESKKIPYKLMGFVSNKYWQSILNFNQVDITKKLSLPIYILNGENDFQVSMVEFNLWKQELTNHTNIQYQSYPKLNHLFLETIDKRGIKEYDVPGHIPQYVIDDLVKFIKN